MVGDPGLFLSEAEEQLMEEHISENPLVAAAHSVCRAVEEHAQACVDDVNDVVGIISAGEALVAAMVEYEGRLLADTGWSNPVRHLGRLPQYASDDPRVPGTGGEFETVPFRVRATYVVEVTDEQGLFNLVDGRGGDHPRHAGDALRFLIESDGWDVMQYPPQSLRLIEADVDIAPAG